MISRGIIANIASSVRERFFDIFSSRSNTTGDLGTASDGSKWSATNGVIEINSGTATATTTPTVFSTTFSSGGASGATTFVVASATGIQIGQAVSGYGITFGTKVSNLVGTTVTLSLPTTNQLAGTYLFLSKNASEYPIATIDMFVNNNSIELTSTNQGSAAAIWVQSSSDWWMVDIESTFNTIPGNGVYSYSQNANSGGNQNAGSGGNLNADTPNYSYYTYQASTTNYFAASSYFSYVNFTSYITYTSSLSYYNVQSTYITGYTPGNYNAFVPGNYNAFVAGTYYTYLSGTNAATYAYAQYLNIKQSVASTVSIINSWLVSTTQTIASLRIKTNGNQITAQAFSDNNLVSQIGSDLVYTATGATITTRFGISVSPSAYQQSAIISSSVKMIRN